MGKIIEIIDNKRMHSAKRASNLGLRPAEYEFYLRRRMSKSKQKKGSRIRMKSKATDCEAPSYQDARTDIRPTGPSRAGWAEAAQLSR